MKIPENQHIIHGGCRLKILKKFLFSIVDRNFLSSFTWTGKTNKSDKRKISFATFGQILDLLFELVKRNDEHYPQKIFKTYLVTNILKHAYEYVIFSFFLLIFFYKHKFKISHLLVLNQTTIKNPDT